MTHLTSPRQRRINARRDRERLEQDAQRVAKQETGGEPALHYPSEFYECAQAIQVARGEAAYPSVRQVLEKSIDRAGLRRRCDRSITFADTPEPRG